MDEGRIPIPEEPPQNLKEYDPEWGRSFWTGTVAASCDHERMLRSVKVPVLLTHHLRITNDATGFLFGAMSDQQAQRVQDLLRAAGVPVEYRSFPDVGHSMHGDNPDLYVDTLLEWVVPDVRLVEQDRRPRPLPAAPLPGRVPRRVTTSPTASGTSRSGRRRSMWTRLTGSASPRPAVDLVARRLRGCEPARDLARAVNEVGRRAVVDHPGGFGLFALVATARRRCRRRRDRPLLRSPRRGRIRVAHQCGRHVPR